MGRRARWTAIAASLTAMGVVGVACGGGETAAAPEPQTPTILDASLGWHGDNHARLEAMIRDLGSTSAGFAPENPPVAVFDWDNTIIKNDIGDAYIAWMLDHDKVIMPPERDWSRVNRWLTPQARAWLEETCGEHPAGQPIPTSTDADCASALYGVYEHSKTADGSPAWLAEGYDHRSFLPALALPAQVQAGYSLEELDGFADQVIELHLAAEQGSVRTVGHDEFEGWIRVYPESRALIAALRAHGFDVWVVSASPEPVVRAFARRVGVDADHVVGIRSVVGEAGKVPYALRGCGSVAEGDDAILTYVDGKRCFVNQVIFGVEGAAAADVQAEHSRRPAFVAGDATTDVSMLRDATALRLVINRNSAEVMCHAYHDADGRWLVNPMYIEPLPARAEPYPCSTTACKDSSGAAVPCLDDTGAVIADQTDRVF